MELLFVTVIGAGIGGIVRYALPHRTSYGIVLLPALAAAVTAAVWVVLLWAGLTFDGTWIWVVSLVAGGGAAIAAALVLPRRRKTTDDRMLAQLIRA
jgi:hypothetical protein